jgi:hypothetical protein
MKRAAVTAAAGRSVFLVAAEYDHEATTPLCAFVKALDARAFVKECEDYRNTRPQCPSSMEDTLENDRAWDRFIRRSDQFKRKHIAGEHAHCDSFSVVEVPLYESNCRSAGSPRIPRKAPT